MLLLLLHHPTIHHFLLSHLQEFLVRYSRLFCEQYAPAVTDGAVQAFVADVLSDAPAGPPRPADCALEFKHVCRWVCVLALVIVHVEHTQYAPQKQPSGGMCVSGRGWGHLSQCVALH